MPDADQKYQPTVENIMATVRADATTVRLASMVEQSVDALIYCPSVAAYKPQTTRFRTLIQQPIMTGFEFAHEREHALALVMREVAAELADRTIRDICRKQGQETAPAD